MVNQSHDEYVAKKHAYTQFLQCEFDTGFHTRHIDLGSHNQWSEICHEYRRRGMHAQRIVERINDNTGHKGDKQ